MHPFITMRNDPKKPSGNHTDHSELCAEIALPHPLSLKVNDGALDQYQQAYKRIMYMRGEVLRLCFDGAVTDIHEGMGTIVVAGKQDTIQHILKRTCGTLINQYHHWSEDKVRSLSPDQTTHS